MGVGWSQQRKEKKSKKENFNLSSVSVRKTRATEPSYTLKGFEGVSNFIYLRFNY
jgi:hypothetical protein